MINEDHHPYCCRSPGADIELIRMEDSVQQSIEDDCNGFPSTNSFQCPICSSLLSSIPWNGPLSSLPLRLCLDCKLDVKRQESQELDKQFGLCPTAFIHDQVDDVDPDFELNQPPTFFQQPRIDPICEERVEKNFKVKDFDGDEGINRCGSSENYKELTGEENKPAKFQSDCKPGDKKVKNAYVQFEDNIQYSSDKDISIPCDDNKGILHFVNICESKEQLEHDEKLGKQSNCLTETKIDSSYRKIDCSEEKFPIEEDMSAFRFKKVDIPKSDNFANDTSRLDGQSKLKDEPISRSKVCTSSNCKSFARTRKPIPYRSRAYSKERSFGSKTQSSKNYFHPDKDASFYEGLLNVKNALSSYFQSRISPKVTRPEEKYRKECKLFCTNSCDSKNDKESSWKVENAKKKCAKHCSVNTEVTKREDNEHGKNGDLEINKNGNSRDDSDCTIHWSLERTSTTNQLKLKGDPNMKPMEGCDPSKMKNSTNSAAVPFPHDSNVTRNNEKKFGEDEIDDNLSESSSDGCIVHSRKENPMSDCEFMDNNTVRKVNNEKLRQKINFSRRLPTNSFDKIKGTGTIQDTTLRRNLFNDFKYPANQGQKR